MDDSDGRDDVLDGGVDGDSAAAADTLAAIRAQQARVRRETDVNGALLFGAWGLALTIGYLALYLGYDAEVQRPSGPAFTVFGLLLVSAMVITGVHIGRQSAGIRGVSARVGAMYGWSWGIAFALWYLIVAAVLRTGVPTETISILTNLLSLLIVAILYMAGGALFDEWRMFALGAWLAVVVGAASFMGVPTSYLLLSLAGGGGFLVAAVGAWIFQRRSAR